MNKKKLFLTITLLLSFWHAAEAGSLSSDLTFCRQGQTILSENAVYIGLGAYLPVAMPWLHTLTTTNCTQFRETCNNFALDWYSSCVFGLGYDCHCRSIELYNGCMDAHGCQGYSAVQMEQLGCN